MPLISIVQGRNFVLFPHIPEEESLNQVSGSLEPGITMVKNFLQLKNNFVTLKKGMIVM